MSARWIPLLTAACLLLCVPDVSGAWDPYTGLEPVLTSPSYAGCTDPGFDWLEEVPCEELLSHPVEGFSFLWVIMTQINTFPEGVGGMQFGIAPGTNARIGFFTLEDGAVNDFIAITDDPRVGESVYADCRAVSF